jgi:hypothetical protein
VLKVVQYTPQEKTSWDVFVRNSKNGHFMFFRDYMDYHAIRFQDLSLMVYDEKNILIGLMPANLADDAFHTHQGLSFGGLLMTQKTTTEHVCNIFNAIKNYLMQRGDVSRILYKKIPDFYCENPSHEDLYALFINDAKIYRRDVSALINTSCKIDYQEMRRRKIKKAIKHGVEFKEINDFDEYWSLLSEVLRNKHSTSPTHTLNEIKYLKEKFPKNIKLFCGFIDDKIISGVVVYETELVAHIQYIASGDLGRELGALDMVIDRLLCDVYQNKKFFDFGISTENGGRLLNAGLMSQKEGFGARAFVHDFYEMKIK